MNNEKTFAYFHLSRPEGENDLHGTITVWGVRGEGTNFHLIIIITES